MPREKAAKVALMAISGWLSKRNAYSGVITKLMLLARGTSSKNQKDLDKALAGWGRKDE